MKKHKGLNGNTWWVAIVLTLVVQTGGAIFWAGGIASEVKSLRRDVMLIVQDMKDLRQEDLKNLNFKFSEIKNDLKRRN